MRYDLDLSPGSVVPPHKTGGWNPTGSAQTPGGIAQYPFAWYGDQVDVVAGKLTKWTGAGAASGGTGDYGFTAWAESLFGDLPGGVFDGAQGKWTYAIDVVSAALTEGTYAPFMLKSVDTTGATFDDAIGLSLFRSAGTVWGVELGYRITSAPGVMQLVQTHTFEKATIIGTTVTLEVCWDCAAGTIHVTMNGTEIYSLSGLALFVSMDNGDNQLRGWTLGGGFAGNLVSMSVDDIGCGTRTNLDESDPCCGDAVDTPTGPGNPGDTLGENPYQSLPPGTGMGCVGYGEVLQATPLTDPENWAI